MEKFLIGIDIGTQGTKAALIDEQLKIRETAFEKSVLLGENTGEIWQDPEEIFLSCVRVIREVLEKSKTGGTQIEAIGIDGQMAGIMGINCCGEAVTYYDSWLDNRCRSYVPVLEKEAGEEIVRKSGGPVTCSHAAKMLWWKEERPDIYKKIAKFVLPHSYVVGRMVGAEEVVFDYTCLHFNSFSRNKEKEWNKELLCTMGISPEKLPRIASPMEIAGKVQHAFSEATGLMEGTPVAVGMGDSAASTFGSGMYQKGRVLDCAGTASIMCSVVDTYVPDTEYKTLMMMRSPVDGLWLPLSYIGGGGMCIRWFRDQLTGKPPASYEILEQEASVVPAGSEGLLFNPHFSGRVLPPEPNMKGQYLGLDFKHTRGAMYRAVLESIAYEYAGYYEILKKNFGNQQFKKLDIVGGGAKSELFNQIKADVLQIETETFREGETALIGSAAAAGVAVGFIADYRERIEKTKISRAKYYPDKKKADIYRKKAAQYKEMLQNMRNLGEEE